MCGITGFLQQNRNRPSIKDLKRMGRTLHHRGPDDEGYFLVNTLNSSAGFEQSEGDVGLAQQRLSIIDLSPLGHQPMPNQEKTIWVNYNGEIYNFQEIRKELVAKGYRFRSHSDTEVIVYAFQEWGIKCIERFIGMFAISIWDSRERKLYLARDRLGIKPLYYYCKDGNFAFASELKAIMEYPYFEKEIDPESLYYYLLFQYVPAPRAIFKNTYKLLPGHYLVISKDGSFEEHTYWDAVERFQLLSKTDHNIDEEETLRGLEELLISSVRYRLISDVPLGMLLSGGIDSSLVAAIMQSINPEPIKTFTIGFRENEFDEAPYAREIAKHLGTDHHELYVTPKEAQTVIPKLPLFYDEPFADSSAIPTYLVSKLAREHVKVALSGDGGDELFGGYNRYEWMNKLARYDLIPYWLRQGVSWSLRLLPEGGIEWAYQLAKPFLPEAFQPIRLKGKKERIASLLKYRQLVELYPMVVGLWQQPELAELLGEEHDLSGLTLHDVYCTLDGENIVTRLMLADLKTYLVDDILTKVDRASMAVSLEDRVPILDHRIVEFTFGLPRRYKYKKYLLKKLLAKYIPPKLYERPKHGFGVPFADWLRGDLRYLVEEYLNPKRLQREGFFNVNAVKRTTEEYMSGRRDHWHRLWALIAFEIWYEHYGK